MKPAIVVGQSDAGKCLIAYLDGNRWVVDTTFPSITGILRGVYYYNYRNVWVAGGTGPKGDIAAILYKWDGRQWIDYSSSVTDATYFTSIRGNTSNNIWIVGPGPNVGGITTGAWRFNGIAWTPTRQNTVNITIDDVSVSAEGYAYTTSYSLAAGYVYSNKTDANWALFATLDTPARIKAVSDSAIYVTRWNGGSHAWFYNGATWTSKAGGGTHCHGVLDADNYWWINWTPSVGHVYVSNNGVVTQIGVNALPAGAGTPFHNAHIYALPMDLWTCGSTVFATTWENTPILSHYEGGTTWSDSTVYDVNALGAGVWMDLAIGNLAYPKKLWVSTAEFAMDKLRMI
jgi:hypothetical protein